MADSAIIGILASLMAAAFFGLYPVPRRYVEFGINDYMISMTLGVLASTVVFSLFSGFPFLSLPTYEIIVGLIAGILWTLGTILYVYSVDCIGVGRATPVKNITAALGVIFGLVIFQEYRGLAASEFVFLSVGTAFIIASGKYLGSVQGKEGVARPSCPVDLIVPDFLSDDRKTFLTAGLIFAVATAFAYGVQSIPVRVLSFSTDSVFEFLPYVGLGAFLTSIVSDAILTSDHTWRKVPLSGHSIAAFSGLLWTVAFIGLAIGIKLVGLSVGWPLAMSSTIFAVFYGLSIGGEVGFEEQRREILQGLAFGILGIILLGMSL